jgi:hypothetical protein
VGRNSQEVKRKVPTDGLSVGQLGVADGPSFLEHGIAGGANFTALLSAFHLSR